MTMVKKLPQRNEVPEELTWDLTTIFKDEADFEKAFEVAQENLGLIDQQAHELNDGHQLLKAIQMLLEVGRQVEKLAVYAQLKNDQDTHDNDSQVQNDRAEALLTSFAEKTAWFEPAVLLIDTDKLDQFYQQVPELEHYRRFLDVIMAKKAHVLSPEVEGVLASASDIFEASAKTFGILDNTDLSFPIVKNDAGQDVQLSQGVYSVLLESADVKVRREAFTKLYSVYEQFQHTLASTLAATVKTHNLSANLRHYDSALDAALAENEIPTAVFTTLIDEVNNHLDLLHRYVELRKQILGVTDLHMYDLYTPLMKTKSPKITYDQAQKLSLAALEVMGPDYVNAVQKEFDGRWIDVIENQYKRSGGYSSGMYDTNPFILLNWQDNLDNLYTLIHETGHSMHSFYSHQAQPYQYGDYSIFVAEIASTTNENILTDYLLKKFADDEEMTKFVLNYYLDGFKGTVFRQTQFAEFESLIHEADANRVPLTADFMNQEYLKLNQKYYGPAVISDPEIRLEWSRIPHFYYDFYVYQYATGFAAATTLAEKIQASDQGRIDYLSFLQAGSSDQPINVMKRAGVDMTQAEYLKDAFKIFEQRLDQLEKLIKG
ncbi:oligoendopeptidase F [Lentilactobacillus senioris DSM 24302 = JCM 17472]|uniref:Oligopeptidase F n=1 Tax=Lentilactobacillus senioris DSM 24302 = JCM 17472 TaxID=1423802 RepID=A0A0R2D2Z5_9LACO|nr:oligoendopeptidase F [Lentilactobacillus senioris]KRM94099.1 oligoendopeptidase F [Lentilactobacillus senioris DSM 24302 = JCM 17472]